MHELSDTKSEHHFIATPLTDKTTGIRESIMLESILAHVELGLVTKKQSAQAATGESKKDQLRSEREERKNRVVGLFNWLRKKKKVKRIVKLIVEDDPDLPCQDETIKKCLQGFEVRNLDWNKDDIDISTLRECAPNVRELWLLWSGRGSTLLGWANKDGGLTTLKHVSLSHELFISFILHVLKRLT